MQKISPFLWFDTQAEEAVNFYTTVFKDSKILNTARYGEGMPLKAGTVMTVSFELQGQQFTALNGGPGYNFNQAISFVVNCESQEEIDEYWKKLTENGGKEVQCGWLTDKYGLSWQIVPTVLGEMATDPNPQKVERLMKAMMKMIKIDIAGLKEAFEG
jgi:predicted 3-demethylubiquinone-9 3-methyltransferase (glyoxalase superfamily)